MISSIISRAAELPSNPNQASGRYYLKMLDRPLAFTGEQDEAELLQHMCALVARDRHYAMASIAAIDPDGTPRSIAYSGSERELHKDAVSVDIQFAVAGEPLLFRAASNNPNAFAELEMDILRELCEAWAAMLKGLRMREARMREERDRANHAEHRLSALWAVANRTLISGYDSKLLARDVLFEGCAQLGLEIGYIARIAGKEMILEHPLEARRLPIEGSIAAEIVRDGATINAMSTALATTSYDQHGSEVHSTARSFIGTRFFASQEQFVIVFASEHSRTQPFTEQDTRYIELLASILCRTMEQRATLDQIEYLQDHDALTRLPHRNRFHARLSELLKVAQRSEPIAVLIIDTDNFRQLLEEHGPEAGDEIVLEMAQRIRLAKGEHHELFRYRSDSFAIIVHGERALTEVHFLAERAIASIAVPMKINGDESRLTASIGIALYPSDGEDVSAISIAATTAMRRAKRMGPGQFRFYNELLDERFGRRRLFAEELREAVHKNELQLYYQPIINLQTRDVIGVEALLRWHHPRRGIVGAAEFIHVAEETDLINEIGAWVLAHAAQQAYVWHEEGRELVVAVNLSARQFRDVGLLADVESVLKSSGTPPALLEFEVTESIAMHDPDRAAYTLACFRDLGLRVALDDFGTGHSSLAYLKRFLIDIIKLDQSFVAGLPSETTSAAIANAVVALSNSLGCEVRAEGIEMPAQEHWLRGIGVHSAQGFLIAPPLLPRAFERWLESSAKQTVYNA